MRAHLQDLVAHLRWADAMAFHALGKSPAAQADSDVLERLFHTAWVAKAFGDILAGGPGGYPTKEVPPFAELCTFMRAAGEALQVWVEAASDADLESPRHIAWFPEPALHIPAREALMQVVMHSQHHRGQTMTRLKQLGGEAKNVDYIIWLWKQKPAPRWN